MPEAPGPTLEVAYVDQGYSGTAARDAAAEHGIELVVVKFAHAKRGSSSCQDGGAWSDRSPGPPDPGALPRTTKGCQRQSKASTSSRSPAWASNTCSISQPQVPDRLQASAVRGLIQRSAARSRPRLARQVSRERVRRQKWW